MASSVQGPELDAVLDRLRERHRNLSLVVPFLYGEGTPTTSTTIRETLEQQNPAQPSNQSDSPSTARVSAPGASRDLDAVIRDFLLDVRRNGGGGFAGLPPASKASIAELPSVEIVGCGIWECAICLEEWREGEAIKEMPCKHRFHGGCVEKWLGIHGSCPVCRYQMPVEEVKKSDEGGQEEERRRLGRQFFVGFSGGASSSSGIITDQNPRSSDSNGNDFPPSSESEIRDQSS